MTSSYCPDAVDGSSNSNALPETNRATVRSVGLPTRRAVSKLTRAYSRALSMSPVYEAHTVATPWRAGIAKESSPTAAVARAMPSRISS